MCREAQRKLYQVLAKYTFAIVTRKTTVPDPAKPYYFTDAPAPAPAVPVPVVELLWLAAPPAFLLLGAGLRGGRPALLVLA